MEEANAVMEKVESVSDAKRDNRRFIFMTFFVGQLIGILLVWLYWICSPSKDKFFHVIVIYGASAITIPMFVCTMRLMLKGYYLSLMGWQSTSRMMEGYEKLQKKAEPIADRIAEVVEKKAAPIVEKIDEIVDRAVPIAEDIEKIAKRAVAVGEDVEKVVQKVRSTAEAMNGSLSAKTLEEVRDSLKLIADHLRDLAETFGVRKRAEDEGTAAESEDPLKIKIPEFDPLKPRRPRVYKR